MFKLDDNLLIELGLGTLPPTEKIKCSVIFMRRWKCVSA